MTDNNMGKDLKANVLRLLRRCDGSVSGQEICEQLGVSRTAVWKVINQLRQEGYQLEAIQNRGYRLLQTPELLTESELKSRIKTAWAGRNLHFYKETESTNLDAKRCMEAGEPHGTLVVADRQTCGRGRRGRSWESPAGEAIYMSLALCPDFAPQKASMLTLVMALSAARAVEETTHIQTGIKWPNDLVMRGKKICGILTELHMEMDYVRSVVVGVGINVNQLKFPEEIQGKATSLALEAGVQITRADLIEKCMVCFEQDYEIFMQTQDLTGLKADYESRLVNKGKGVCILDPAGEYEGTALGIENTGELQVRKTDGTLVQVYAGEVSVRGYYGYV